MKSISDLKYAKDTTLAASFGALRRAAKIARETAIQTGTGIVVMDRSKIVHVSAAALLKKQHRRKSHNGQG